jgi:hypothetical protein
VEREDQEILSAHIAEVRELAQFLIQQDDKTGLAWVLIDIMDSEKKLAKGQADGDSHS